MSHGPVSTALAADWKARAACAGYANTYFFPANDAPNFVTSRAKAICAECPVSTECLEYALNVGETHGIWGGKNELERRRMMRARQTA